MIPNVLNGFIIAKKLTKPRSAVFSTPILSTRKPIKSIKLNRAPFRVLNIFLLFNAYAKAGKINTDNIPKNPVIILKKFLNFLPLKKLLFPPGSSGSGGSDGPGGSSPARRSNMLLFSAFSSCFPSSFNHILLCFL